MDDHHTQAPSNNHSTALLLAGSLLVVIAMFTIVTTGWKSYNSAARILITLLPVFALYAIAFGTEQKANLATISRYTLFTSSAVVSFAIGVIVHELQHPTGLPASFFFPVAAITAAVYLLLEFVFKKYEHAPLTITFVLLSCYYLAIMQGFSITQYATMGIVVSASLLLAAFFHDHTEHPWQANGYASTAIIVGFFGLLMLPIGLIDGTKYSSISNVTTSLYILIGLFCLLIAVMYGNFTKKYPYPHLYLVRLAFEYFAAVFIFGSAFINALGDMGNTLKALVLILAGTLNIAISGVVRTSIYRITGIIGVVFGTILLITFTYTQLHAIWPILLLIGGFLLIGSAYYIQKVDYKAILSRITQSSTTTLLGIGDPDPSKYNSTVITLSSPIIIIILLVLGYFTVITIITNSADTNATQASFYTQTVPLFNDSPTFTPETTLAPTPTQPISLNFTDWTTKKYTLASFTFSYDASASFSLQLVPGTSTVYAIDPYYHLSVEGSLGGFTNVTNIPLTSPSVLVSRSSSIINGHPARTITLTTNYYSQSLKSITKITEIALPDGLARISVSPINPYTGADIISYTEKVSYLQDKVANSVR